MNRLSMLAAAALLAGAAHAQTVPPTTDLPPSVGTNPTMPAEVTPGSTAAQPPAAGTPNAVDGAAATSGTGSAAEQVKNDRQAAATEMKRISREGAQAQRDAVRGGGEMSTPQQDRGGYSGLGDESPVPMR